MKLLPDTTISFTRRYPEDNGAQIIDYVNGIEPSKLSPNEYETMAALYEELRRIAKEFGSIIEIKHRVIRVSR
jgi:hypothetical protein